ncbi:hypothetical protein GCM10025864_39700 [Luteimicrobium album]|uniref:Uncharacterized protein n=1 Tax=Luteimicrobium album TaxID=1054550 RepID=A0ABQ6I6A8_9MICO|nr:hypothetical protein [Luteimicrobium album]GMA26211.1 hypothetical protein GCM10025864_39700 [Luteimicrobium album]
MRADLLWRQRVRAPRLPVLYGHTYTGLPSGAPSWASGYGPMRAPAFVIGDVQVITLPAVWVTALIASTLAGIGLYDTDPSNGFMSLDLGALDGGASITNSGYLLITYSGGTT